MGVIGEVGLTGEIRAVPNVDKRIQELRKLGFSGCIVPEKGKGRGVKDPNFKCHYVSHVKDILEIIQAKAYAKQY